MRRIVLVALLGLSAWPAQAQRVSTTALSCPEARSVVTRAGGIVLGTGGPTYDRFVANRSFCEATEYAKAAYAPTRTDPRCFIGYTCYEPGATDWLADR
ncbi:MULTISPECIES: hypothetical protein [Methylobacterium]|uniref:Uncharacterized protein n=1 Tax=Methylobacterium jeotgali TaxID=381630 RepID=A0ABQ4SPP2_9HYPH|nr:MULTISPECIES: hypothetical protein [Methylobacterium]PIU07712.1 MAG: hypothetical protein COT56_04140 [Methylobacterium sp. CG09_land_8_20_14_0_10_71_15]PIU11415.1 MAG: hypothetical protein COT28_20255 [Methylobacterium sp. CG08_land_8_20_14_0_20_71_15]GBU18592.1 hypothetical protein AwMethylo_28070 [Methylobacterium sp.]GJE05122.1 hypothetical protein AOPFMNJM_0419 [Methylobacterium jeotgali]